MLLSLFLFVVRESLCKYPNLKSQIEFVWIHILYALIPHGNYSGLQFYDEMLDNWLNYAENRIISDHYNFKYWLFSLNSNMLPPQKPDNMKLQTVCCHNWSYPHPMYEFQRYYRTSSLSRGARNETMFVSPLVVL